MSSSPVTESGWILLRATFRSLTGTPIRASLWVVATKFALQTKPSITAVFAPVISFYRPFKVFNRSIKLKPHFKQCFHRRDYKKLSNLKPTISIINGWDHPFVTILYHDQQKNAFETPVCRPLNRGSTRFSCHYPNPSGHRGNGRKKKLDPRTWIKDFYKRCRKLYVHDRLLDAQRSHGRHQFIGKRIRNAGRSSR